MMIENSKVSVIVPAYNIEQYIDACVQSIISQTYAAIEIILVDDGSRDLTGEKCDQLALLDERICVIHQSNQGVVEARRAGLHIATGRYVLFVDGDDWIDADMIGQMVKIIGDCDLACTGVLRERMKDQIERRTDAYQEGIYKDKQEWDKLLSTLMYDDEMHKLQPLTPWLFNKLFLREKLVPIYQKVDKELSYGEDCALVYTYLLNANSVAISHNCYYHYRYREESAIHKENDNRIADILKVYTYLKDLFAQENPQYDLMYQLQKWFVLNTCLTINHAMGMDERVSVPQYIGDYSDLKGKRIILYGAGQAGQDLKKQLEYFGYQVVLWVDKAYEHYQGQGFFVESPNRIFEENYDSIVIAVGAKTVAEAIKRDLIAMHVREDCIVWRELLSIY